MRFCISGEIFFSLHTTKLMDEYPTKLMRNFFYQPRIKHTPHLVSSGKFESFKKLHAFLYTVFPQCTSTPLSKLIFLKWASFFHFLPLVLHYVSHVFPPRFVVIIIIIFSPNDKAPLIALKLKCILVFPIKKTNSRAFSWNIRREDDTILYPVLF